MMKGRHTAGGIVDECAAVAAVIEWSGREDMPVTGTERIAQPIMISHSGRRAAAAPGRAEERNFCLVGVEGPEVPCAVNEMLILSMSTVDAARDFRHAEARPSIKE
jgi:hypothetical protein